MKCPTCQAELTDGQTACSCGERVSFAPPTKPPPVRHQKSDPRDSSMLTAREFASHHNQLKTFINQYLTEHPGTNKREACFEYFKRQGITHAVPEHLLDPEAKAEREAIAAEGNS